MAYCVISPLPAYVSVPVVLGAFVIPLPLFILQTLTEKVDIYGMGMILYSLASGEIPFGKDEETTNKILKGEKPVFDAYWHAGYMEVRGGCC